MEELRTLLLEFLDETLLYCVLSGQRRKEGPVKIKIRPLLKKGRLVFQAALWDGKKEFHVNYEKEEMIQAILALDEPRFPAVPGGERQPPGSCPGEQKGKSLYPGKEALRLRETAGAFPRPEEEVSSGEGTPVPYLVKLGVMTREGKVVKDKYDKFRQINRFLEFIRDVCGEFSREEEISILDFGCGKSYLTFAVYDYLCRQMGYRVNITGLDLKEDVIARCGELAAECGYENLISEPETLPNMRIQRRSIL